MNLFTHERIQTGVFQHSTTFIVFYCSCSDLFETACRQEIQNKHLSTENGWDATLDFLKCIQHFSLVHLQGGSAQCDRHKVQTGCFRLKPANTWSFGARSVHERASRGNFWFYLLLNRTGIQTDTDHDSQCLSAFISNWGMTSHRGLDLIWFDLICQLEKKPTSHHLIPKQTPPKLFSYITISDSEIV